MAMHIRLCVAAIALAAAATACAQPVNAPPGPATAPAREEFARGQAPMMGQGQAFPDLEEMTDRNFFTPELVMRHQKRLELTEDQQKAIKTEIVNFATRAADLRWEHSTAQGELAELLSQAQPDEKAILAKEEKLLKIENDIKLARLAMLIRIKNALTPEQQKKLTELREHMEHRLWPRPMTWRHGEMGPGQMHPGGGMGPRGEMAPSGAQPPPNAQ
jgi:Spy/CpxP family protein refolding chaperone